jgi:hypothetical protein
MSSFFSQAEHLCLKALIYQNGTPLYFTQPANILKGYKGSTRKNISLAYVQNVTYEGKFLTLTHVYVLNVFLLSLTLRTIWPASKFFQVSFKFVCKATAYM